ncbi:MAG: zf-HC2 domain-containing protein [Candidatus Latescibacteria bacterium]|nr:zf-HC2 domain-containing protein [Candidatus Latescibacterota bacterium]
MYTCREIMQVLTAYLEGDLSRRERKDLERHMVDCPPCHAFLRTFEKTGEMARTALQPEQIPDELQERVRHFLKDRLGLQ